MTYLAFYKPEYMTAAEAVRMGALHVGSEVLDYTHLMDMLESIHSAEACTGVPVMVCVVDDKTQPKCIVELDALEVRNFKEEEFFDVHKHEVIKV